MELLLLKFLIVISVFTFSNVLASNSDSNGNDEDYWSWYSSEELECPDDQFWHIRGQQCVPFYCPGGNSKRNLDTGECLHQDSDITTESSETTNSVGQSGNVPTGEENGISTTGWPIGSKGFFQPRGMSIDPMFKLYDGKRGGTQRFAGIGKKRKMVVRGRVRYID